MFMCQIKSQSTIKKRKNMLLSNISMLSYNHHCQQTKLLPTLLSFK
jgi:hypothetical protein